MKSIVQIILIAFTISAIGQERTIFTVTLKANHGDSNQIPTQFDTIHLCDDHWNPINTFINISSTNTTFKLPDIKVGKYWIWFSSKKYCVSALKIVVCSLCGNEFEFLSSLQKLGEDCNIFTMVEISPYYLGGRGSLAKDFRKSVKHNERKQIRMGPKFTVSFFVTRKGFISDPAFSPTELSEDIKNIVVKGLAHLHSWRPGERNGRKVDCEYTLDSKSLLTN